MLKLWETGKGFWKNRPVDGVSSITLRFFWLLQKPFGVPFLYSMTIRFFQNPRVQWLKNSKPLEVFCSPSWVLRKLTMVVWDNSWLQRFCISRDFSWFLDFFASGNNCKGWCESVRKFAFTQSWREKIIGNVTSTTLQAFQMPHKAKRRKQKLTAFLFSTSYLHNIALLSLGFYLDMLGHV